MAQPSEPKIDQLLALVSELKDDVNKLRTDFLTHDHSTSYSATTLRMNESGITPSGGTSTAIAGNVPSKMFQV